MKKMKFIMESWNNWLAMRGLEQGVNRQQSSRYRSSDPVIDLEYFRDQANNNMMEFQIEIVDALNQELRDPRSLTQRQKQILDVVHWRQSQVRGLGFQTDTHAGAELGEPSAYELSKRK